MLSFHGWAEGLSPHYYGSTYYWGYNIQHWEWLIPVGVACIASAFFWVGGISAAKRALESDPVAAPKALPFYLASPVDLMAAAGLAVMLIAIILHLDIPAMIAGNLVCIGISVGLIWAAYRTGARKLFWAGLLFFALVAVSRFFEWDTGLFVKAIVFILIGVGVLYGGLAFERHLKKAAGGKGAMQ
jgi:hypothetical protein